MSFCDGCVIHATAYAIWCMIKIRASYQQKKLHKDGAIANEDLLYGTKNSVCEEDVLLLLFSGVGRIYAAFA